MLRYAEMALAAVAIIILTGTNAYYFQLGVPPEITPEEIEVYELAIRNVFLLAYGIVALLALLHWQKMLLGIVAIWPVALMVAIAWISTTWSVDPETTQRRCIALSVTTLMGVYLFVRFDLDQLLRFLVLVFAIIIVSSLAWVFLFPDYGIHGASGHTGAWRGVFFHKNANGRVMVFALAALIAAWAGGHVNRGILGIIALLAIANLIGSASKTALLACLALAMGVIAVNMMRGAAVRSALITLTIFAIVWHAGLLVFFSYESILEFLGRDATLTGRTELWTFTIAEGLKRPLTGFGYDAFWFGDNSPGARIALEWGISHAHNSWIEVFINLGLPVIVLLAVTLAIGLVRAVVLARYYPDVTPALFVMVTLLPMLTISMSEAVFLERHTIDWMMTVAALGCARAYMSKLNHGDERSGAPAATSLSGLDNPAHVSPA
ncbi:MAG: O-antigen ligase family protein [Rhizobiales bacterium]|nr:O-antigen ligase family protein [Hyphomicrobiales bacterium]